MTDIVTENQGAVMIDLETMGTTAGAPILTIGAVLFNPRACDTVDALEKRALLIRVDVEDAVKHSEGVDGGTLRWWLGQEDAAIKELINGTPVGLKTALQQLSAYCVEREKFFDEHFFEGFSKFPPVSEFWAKDPDFDMVLLRYAYEQLGLNLPWKFWDCRSVRTAQAMAWSNPDDRPKFNAGTLHDARADVVNQALLVQAAYRELGLSNDDSATFSKYHPPGP